MKNGNKNLINEEYYSNRPRKIGDFFLGYLGFLIFGFIAFAYSGFGNGATLSVVLLLVISIIINVKTKKNRRYIARGANFALITLILIPVILLGACFIELSNYHGG
jgi:hypothetical protein